MESATFSGNSAGITGGAISNTGPVAAVTPNAVTASGFTGNRAGTDGGAIYTTSALNLTTDSMSGNRAGTFGGGLALGKPGGAVVLTTTDIFGNRANISGGGIRVAAGTVTFRNNSLVTQNLPNNCLGVVCPA